MKSAPFSGNSMWPLLRDGDEVLFDEVTSDIITGDIILFRDSSEFVVHRVSKLSPFTTKGDWSCANEEHPMSNVFGIIKGFSREGVSFLLTDNFFIKIVLYCSGLL